MARWVLHPSVESYVFFFPVFPSLALLLPGRSIFTAFQGEDQED